MKVHLVESFNVSRAVGELCVVIVGGMWTREAHIRYALEPESPFPCLSRGTPCLLPARHHDLQ